MPSCVCCGLGSRVLKQSYLCLWGIVAAAPRLLESWFVVPPSRYMLFLVTVQWTQVIVGTLFGLLLSYGIFMPLARWSATDEVALCVSYTVLFSWAAAHVLVGWFAYRGWVHRYFVGTVCCCTRIDTPDDGFYFGLLLGLSFAFPVAAMRQTRLDESGTAISSDWCQPASSVSVFFLYVLVFVGCMFSALARGKIVTFEPDPVAMMSTTPTNGSPRSQTPQSHHRHHGISATDSSATVEQRLVHDPLEGVDKPDLETYL